MNKTQEQIYETMTKHAEQKIEKLTELQALSKTIPMPELPDGIYTVASNDLFMLWIGFSPDNVHLVFEKMKDAGWENTYEPDDIISSLKSGKESSEFVSWNHDDFKKSIYAYIVVGGVGSNCKRIKIGNEMVEKDIYEVVCNEGIEEDK